MAERIDAHLHLWRFSAPEYEWLAEPAFAGLRRDFLLPTLQPVMQEAAVDGGIAVQARQTLEETQWLLALARTTLDGESRPLLRGVVGWAPLAAAEFPGILDSLRAEPELKGLRHIVQAEPPGFLEGGAFQRGVAAMAGTGLVYELLVTEGQMEEAIAFVDRHPRQLFVLDHLGKPRIAAGTSDPWAKHARAMARRENVTCKVSGMVTEAGWATWTPATLRPYLDVVVDAFGTNRLMAGSDWPVCLVASSYERWWRVLDDYFGGFSADEQAAVFGGVATRVYKL